MAKIPERSAIASITLVCMMLASTFTVMAGSPAPPDDGVDGLQYIDGDWIVSGAESYTDEIIVLSGNLTIQGAGSLTLTNTTIQMNCTYGREYGITVMSGGALFLYDGGDGFTPMEAGDSDPSVISVYDNNYHTFMIVETNAVFESDMSIIEYVGTLGQAGYVRSGATAEINLGEWQGVSNGEFRITIDGVAQDISGLDFTTIGSLTDVADIITGGIQAADTTQGYINADCDWDGSRFIIYSGTYADNIGSPDSTVAPLQAHSAPTGTDISGLTASTFGLYLDLAANALSVPMLSPEMQGTCFQSDNVQISESLIQYNGHGLIFDSCIPTVLSYNNISDNDGFGLGIVNIADPGFDATGALSDNNVVLNSEQGVYVNADSVDLDFSFLNVSENSYGITVIANRTIDMTVLDCTIWRNDGSTDQDNASLYVWTPPTGNISLTVESSVIAENNCGGVWVGTSYTNPDISSANVLASFVGNRIFGNQGGNRYNAMDDLDLTMRQNYLGGSDYYDEGGRYIIGFNTQGSGNAPCDNVTLNLIGNELNYGMPWNGWSITHAFRVIADNIVDVNISDNKVRGAYELYGLFIIGDSYDQYYPQVINAQVWNNDVVLLDDTSNNAEIRHVFFFNALRNIDIEFMNNYYFTSIRGYFWTNWNKGGHLWIGGADFCNATIQGNTMILKPIDSSTDWSSSAYHGPMYVWANLELNVDVVDNFIDVHELADDSYDAPYFIMFGGDEGFWDELCQNVTLNFVDNTVRETIYGGGEAGIGMIRVLADDQLDCNFTGNDLTFNHVASYGSTAELEGMVKLGGWSNTEAEDVNLIFNGNNLQGNFGEDVDAGGALRVVANNNITADLNDNVIQGWWGYSPDDEDNAEDFGVRIGYICPNDGITSENTVVTMRNNVIGPGGVGSALAVVANNNVTFSFDGGEVQGAFYGDCGGTGSFGNEITYGNGIMLLAENCLTADIKDANIHDNRGAGIFIESVNDATVEISNSFVHDNYWDGIRLVSQDGWLDASSSITETEVSDNCDDRNGDFGSNGWGLYAYHASVYLENCTFDNTYSPFEFYCEGLSDVETLNTTFDKDLVYLGDATDGTLYSGPHIENDWTQWAALTDASFNITIDGVSTDITVDINAAAPATMDGVAAAIEAAIQAAVPTNQGFMNCQVSWSLTYFYIVSGTNGMLSEVQPLLPHSLGSGTDISGATASVTADTYWLDCDANESVVELGYSDNLLVQWFMHVKAVQQSSGVGLPLTDITVRDASNNIVGTGTTGLDGYARWFVVGEYFQATTLGTADYRSYYTPHDVYGIKGLANGQTLGTVMDASQEVWVYLDYVTLPPNANAGADQTVDEDASMTFNGTLSTDDWAIVTYEWTFNDGAPQTLYGEEPTYTFIQPGVYTVTLTVTDYEGFFDTDTVVITVNDVTPPTANAGPDQTVNEGANVLFAGSGTDNVAVTNYTWTFTHNAILQTLYETGPSFVFAIPGAYLVTLTTSDAAGLTATDTMWVTVADIALPVPVAGAGQTVGEGTTVTLDGSASTDNVGIAGYRWTFNDGANDVVALAPTLDHTFTILGNYTATLMVWDAAGNFANGTTYINVVDVTAPSVLVVAPGDSLIDVPLDWELIIVFTEPMNTALVEAAFSINGTTVGSFTWDATDTYVTIAFDDILIINTTYDFGIAANATDKAGNAITAAYADSFTTIVGVKPFANAGSDVSARVNASIAFDATDSYDPDGAILSYLWQFGYGANGTGATVSHAFTSPGAYVVTLTVTDNDGLTSTDTLKVRVVADMIPIAIAGPGLIARMDTPVDFDGSDSYDEDGTIASYAWNFGDNSTGTGATQTHTYASAGTFTVTLTVTDNDGHTATDTLTATIFAGKAPYAVANSNITAMANTAVSFDGSASHDVDGTIVSYSWNFGDGSADVLGMTATHTYTTVGTYTVTLTVTDNDGKSSTDTLVVTVADSIDTDGDGIVDAFDTDSDGDSIPDVSDSMPLDTDNDGLDNAVDPDDDNDDVLDVDDTDPIDSETGEETSEPSFVEDYWWIFIVIALVAVIVLQFIMGRKKPEPAVPEAETKLAEPEEMDDEGKQ
ncbi:MAG: PKD domain-containing protein [Methanobacteriota archaeon]